MKKISIIYWSGTGNTEAMANLIAEGATSADSTVTVLNVSEASIDDIKNADVVALGSPSMGVEVIEETEMEPFVESISSVISGKKLALFGSYGWGDGEWMRNWVDRMSDCGAYLINDGLAVQGAPEGEGMELCIELGEKIKSC